MIYVLFFYSYSFIILNQNKNVPLQWHLSDDMLWCKWGTIILPLSNLYMSQHRREDGLLDLGKKKLIMIKNSDLGFKMGFLQQKKKTQINIIRLKVQQKTAVLLVNMQAAWGGGGETTLHFYTLREKKWIIICLHQIPLERSIFSIFQIFLHPQIPDFQIVSSRPSIVLS